MELTDISVKTEEISLDLPQTVKKETAPQGNITLLIDGMMCEHCVRHVKEALESVDGVTDINVSLEENKATVTAAPDKIQAMIDAITAEDYEVTDVITADTAPQGSITLLIDGMMCEHCVRHVKEALESVDGVTDINVSLEENKATVTASPDKIRAMIDAITAEDYEVTDVINAQ